MSKQNSIILFGWESDTETILQLVFNPADRSLKDQRK